MPSGIMKRWNDEKGFGFIEREDGGDDVFCHATALLDGQGSVMEGDRVRFKVTYDDRKGKDRATDVELASGGGGGGGGGRYRSRSRGRGGGGGGGSYGGGGGKGVGKPGDWDCPKCGAMNFASRVECFKCGAPKSSGGRGGGRDRDDRYGGRDRDDRYGGRDRDYDRYGGRDRDDRYGGRDRDDRYGDRDRGYSRYDRDRDYDRDYDRRY